MKKWFLLVALLMFPIFVNAASLVSSISVDGIGDLTLNRNTWNLTLTTTLDYVDIDVVTVAEGTTVEGAGKVEVQEGANELAIKVSDGTTTENYTININIRRPSIDESGNPDTGAFIPTALIICGIISFGVLMSVRKKMYKI